MATYQNGINGTFYGRLGNVIGSHWKNVNYVKCLSNKPKGIKSPAQLKQQAKFALIVRFLSKFRNLLNISFNSKSGRMTGANEALSYNMANGISGDYPNLEINYPAIRVSRGTLCGALNARAIAGEAGAVDFSWENEKGERAANGYDFVILAIYNPLTQEAYFTREGEIRGTGTASLTIAANRNCEVETWLAFLSINGKITSNSMYTGRVTTT